MRVHVCVCVYLLSAAAIELFALVRCSSLLLPMRQQQQLFVFNYVCERCHFCTALNRTYLWAPTHTHAHAHRGTPLPAYAFALSQPRCPASSRAEPRPRTPLLLLLLFAVAAGENKIKRKHFLFICARTARPACARVGVAKAAKWQLLLVF